MPKKLLITLFILGSVFLFTQDIIAQELININTANTEELDTFKNFETFWIS